MFGFELGPHAPRISEGIVCSKQGSAGRWGGEPRSVYVSPWPGARQREQCDRDGSRRLLRACVIQRQSIQPLRSCPEGGFAGGKERSLSTPLPLASAAVFAERSIWSFLSERLVYAVQMCTMRWFCFLALQMCTDGKMSSGKGGGYGGGSLESPQSGRWAGITELGIWGGACGWPELTSSFCSRRHRDPGACDVLAAE